MCRLGREASWRDLETGEITNPLTSSDVQTRPSHPSPREDSSVPVRECDSHLLSFIFKGPAGDELMGSLGSWKLLGCICHSAGNCHFSSVQKSCGSGRQKTLRNCKPKPRRGGGQVEVSELDQMLPLESNLQALIRSPVFLMILKCLVKEMV